MRRREFLKIAGSSMVAVVVPLPETPTPALTSPTVTYKITAWSNLGQDGYGSQVTFTTPVNSMRVGDIVQIGGLNIKHGDGIYRLTSIDEAVL